MELNPKKLIKDDVQGLPKALAPKSDPVQEPAPAKVAPTKDQLEPGTSAAVYAAFIPKPGARRVGEHVLLVAGQHEVAPGETLRSIAAKLLDSPDRWKEIWELNLDKIPNPDLLTASTPEAPFMLDIPPY